MKIQFNAPVAPGIELNRVPHGTVVTRASAGDTVYMVANPMDGTGGRVLVALASGGLKIPASPDTLVMPREAMLHVGFILDSSWSFPAVAEPIGHADNYVDMPLPKPAPKVPGLTPAGKRNALALDLLATIENAQSMNRGIGPVARERYNNALLRACNQALRELERIKAGYDDNNDV